MERNRRHRFRCYGTVVYRGFRNRFNKPSHKQQAAQDGFVKQPVRKVFLRFEICGNKKKNRLFRQTRRFNETTGRRIGQQEKRRIRGKMRRFFQFLRIYRSPLETKATQNNRNKIYV